MGYLRAAMATTGFLIIVLLGYMLFTFDAGYQLDMVQEAFLRGEWKEASRLLDQVGTSLSREEKALYRSYILRCEGDVEKSCLALDGALSAREKKGASPDLLKEVYFNQLLNFYLLQDRERFQSLLYEVQNVEDDSGYLNLFWGLGRYLEGEYSSARKIWERKVEVTPMSPWMEVAFREYFADHWKVLHLAHCYLEEGDTLGARRMVESVLPDLSGERQLDAWYYLGLSYLRELEDRPASTKSSYMKLGLSFLERVPMGKNCYADQRKKLAVILERTARSQFEQGEYGELGLMLQALEGWGAQNSLDALEETILETAKQAIQRRNWVKVRGIAHSVIPLFQNTHVSSDLLSFLEKKVEGHLSKGEVSNLSQYWELAQGLSSDIIGYEKRVSKQLRETILSLIPDDDSTLHQSTPYLCYWEVVERDHSKRAEFAEELVSLAGAFWLEKGEDEKALAILRGASMLPFLAEKKQFCRRVEAVLKCVYVMALKEDDILRLTAVRQAMQEFQIQGVNIQDAAEVANQLADAQHFYKKQRWEDATVRLELILAINPEHKGARRLQGLIHYKNQQYEQALRFLEKNSPGDAEAEEAIAVSQLCSGDRKEGLNRLLAYIESHKLPRELALTVGFELLNPKEVTHAKLFLKGIEEENQAVHMGLCAAAYYQKEWQESLSHFEELDAPYSSLYGIQLMAAEALGHLGERTAASRMIERVLNSQKQPDTEELHSCMREFKKHQLDQLDQFYFAGQIYRTVLRSPDQALHCYQYVQKNNWELDFAVASARRDLGNLTEARELFEKVRKEADHSQLRGDALKALAEIDMQRGLLTLAAREFEEFFKENSHSLERESYLKILEQFGRWDLVLRQLERLQQNGSKLSLDQHLLSLRCGLFLGKKDLIKRECTQLLKEQKNLTLSQKVHFHHLLSLAKEESLGGMLKNQLQLTSPKDAEEALFLAIHAKNQGDFVRAGDLIEEYGASWPSSSEVLEFLVDYYIHIHAKDQALGYLTNLVQAALPYKKYGGYLEELPEAKGVFVKRVQNLQDFTMKNPQEEMAKMVYVHEAAQLLQLQKKRGLVEEGSYLRQLDCLQEALSQIQGEQKAVDVHYLQAKLSSFQEKREQMELHLGKVFQWVPNHPGALRLQGKYALAHHLISQGTDALFQSLRLEPSSRESLELLLRCYLEEKEFVEAKHVALKLSFYYPRDFEYRLSLAHIYYGLHRPGEALDSLARFLEKNPDHEEALVLKVRCLYHEKFTDSSNSKQRTERKHAMDALIEKNAELAEQICKELNVLL